MDKKPKKGEYLEVILRSSQTVFSTRDVALLWGEDRSSVISNRLKSYAKSGKLIRIHHGLYAKDNNYNRFELATRINTPSYVSFETILTQEGVNFQYYSAIYVASYINREMVIGGQKITFIRMKDDVVSDTTGIEHRDGYARATKERAFLDRLYISKEYHFDNTQSLDQDRVFEILPIYHNKRLEKKVKEYFNSNK